MDKMHLTINNRIALGKILDFLHSFDKGEVQYAFDVDLDAEDEMPAIENSLQEPAVAYETYANDPVFLANKHYLEKVVERMDAGLATYYTLEELEEKLDETLVKCENCVLT